MATSRSDRRPAVDIEPVAGPEEAAAIVAAIGHALAEAEADAVEDEPSVDPWLRAGRFEAVSGFPGRAHPDAHPDPWVAMGRSYR